MKDPLTDLVEAKSIEEAKRIDTKKFSFLGKLTIDEYKEFRNIFIDRKVA